MRYIAVFLLLANLAYFGWNQYRPGPLVAPLVHEQRPLLNTGLMLISEFDAQVAAQQRINEEASRLCAIVGSFPTVDEAKSFIAASADRGLGARLNMTGELIPPQYRVYLPPLTSRSIATITLDGLSERIAGAGLQIETYLITRGLLENAIALGLFARSNNAAAVRNQVVALGYRVEIEEIPQSTGEIQVQLTPLDSAQIDNVEWLDLAADRPYLSRTEILCETIAQGPQFP